MTLLIGKLLLQFAFKDGFDRVKSALDREDIDAPVCPIYNSVMLILWILIFLLPFDILSVVQRLSIQLTKIRHSWRLHLYFELILYRNFKCPPSETTFRFFYSQTMPCGGHIAKLLFFYQCIGASHFDFVKLRPNRCVHLHQIRHVYSA